MIILDTHVWLKWIINNGAGLPNDILAALHSEPKMAVSAISSFEVVYLVKRRRVELPIPVLD